VISGTGRMISDWLRRARRFAPRLQMSDIRYQIAKNWEMAQGMGCEVCGVWYGVWGIRETAAGIWRPETPNPQPATRNQYSVIGIRYSVKGAFGRRRANDIRLATPSSSLCSSVADFRCLISEKNGL
jgi:hypothetical protein